MKAEGKYCKNGKCCAQPPERASLCPKPALDCAESDSQPDTNCWVLPLFGISYVLHIKESEGLCKSKWNHLEFLFPLTRFLFLIDYASVTKKES